MPSYSEQLLENKVKRFAIVVAVAVRVAGSVGFGHQAGSKWKGPLINSLHLRIVLVQSEYSIVVVVVFLVIVLHKRTQKDLIVASTAPKAPQAVDTLRL